MRPVSVVIPAYRGCELLRANLPALVRAAAAHGQPVEIIVVVDDGGTDGTPEMLATHFSEVRVLVNPENLGFGRAVNRGVAAATHGIVLALNTDIVVDEGLFCHALHWFDDPAVFSVTPDMVDPGRRFETQSLTRLKHGPCWFLVQNLQPCQLATLEGEIPILFGSGGGSFFDRDKYLALEGFDPLYRPFYIEDIDLGYRAWKAGWKCLFEPRTRVEHETSSTIGSLAKRRRIKLIGDRNRHLFLWANIGDPWLMVRYFLALPFSLLYDLIGFRKYKLAGFFWALRDALAIPAARRRRRLWWRTTDRAILQTVRWP